MFPELFRDDVFRLETERLWLRWPAASDAPSLRKYAGTWEVARWMSKIPHPFPKEAADSFIAAARGENLEGSALHLAIAARAKPQSLIGLISLKSDQSACVRLGYWLGEPHWGAGYMQEALNALLDLLWRATDLQIVEADAMADNARSRKVLRALGFLETHETVCLAIASGGQVPAVAFRLARPHAS